MDGYPEALHLSEPGWPVRCITRPDDLTKFVPHGFSIGAPMPFQPSNKAPADPDYGPETLDVHPFLNVPISDSCGGTVYFDGTAPIAVLAAGLELILMFRGVDYVAFASSSDDPLNDRYLDQVRFVSNHALKSLFGADGTEPAPKQTLSVVEAAVAFVEAQKSKWDFWALQGTAGGDGDWAKEHLAFGFHVENNIWGVYRIWSRSWLVTK